MPAKNTIPEIKLSVEQIKKMKYCIGLEKERIKRGKYQCYRNYYNAGLAPDPDLDYLVSVGLADYQKEHRGAGETLTRYWLTPKGIFVLAYLFEIKIEIEERKQ